MDKNRGLQGPGSLPGPGPAWLGQKILAGPSPGSSGLLNTKLYKYTRIMGSRGQMILHGSQPQHFRNLLESTSRVWAKGP